MSTSAAATVVSAAQKAQNFANQVIYLFDLVMRINPFD